MLKKTISSSINKKALLLTFLFLFGCSSFGYQSPHYVKLAHEITEKTAKKLEEEKGLFLVGTGGQMMGDIQMMAMSFTYYQEVDLKAARELALYVVGEYLSAINDSKEVRPYLNEYPFGAKNIEIVIFIYKQNRSELPPEKIYHIDCVNGRLEYYIRANSHQAICEETYEEAFSHCFVNTAL
jgi:hypothetical protein